MIGLRGGRRRWSGEAVVSVQVGVCGWRHKGAYDEDVHFGGWDVVLMVGCGSEGEEGV